jgi:hypothetical protein
VRLAFLTGAVAAALTGAAVTALVVWIVTVIAGSAAPWSVAPALIGLVAIAFGAGTYLAERIAYRRTLARMRATGEPWAFREEG